ncbi:hypothetical protein SAMN05421770_103467 [Granulicella rosea]|uniref:Uncharacterized protein n=1 Tax=Granulicella rosea TaxID=474952 RepID=A0A239JA76_9BACT|nr:hypothetical protein [Granulicella rosea]SNT01554.1 hypothetical protein SAMN05421770_103467 [Granulicella rosea]
MRRTIWLLALGLATAPVVAGGQQNGIPTIPASEQTAPGPANHRPSLGDGTGSELNPSTQERLGIARMTERQRLLIADTDKLLELAQALKKDVDKTDKNMLSLDVVKRAEAIEKLARSVKEREKGTK